ncbi:hypothetical protein [Novipirellula aureliae]|uniref:hypothetical protein n=1 Tax=Novipirellula aureliae TaxID=2527966 RepID=UPI0011B76C64|nr:hypothetical protein [Novipirellula aureliae]
MDLVKDPNAASDLVVDLVKDPNATGDLVVDLVKDPNAASDLVVDLVKDPNAAGDLVVDLVKDPNATSDRVKNPNALGGLTTSTTFIPRHSDSSESMQVMIFAYVTNQLVLFPMLRHSGHALCSLGSPSRVSNPWHCQFPLSLGN